MAEPYASTYQIPIKELVGTKYDPKDEIKRLRSKHPVYTRFEPEWKMQDDFYCGGARVINSEYIARHHREDEAEFSDRVKRADYENYTALVIDFFSSFIFSEPIARQGGKHNDFFVKFEKNVDKRGHDINQFMRRVATRFQLYGMCYVLVESPRSPKGTYELLTKQEEEELGLNPYWVLVNPGEILDWDTDDFGQYTYVKRCQKVFGRGADKKLLKIERYTEWTKDTITITEVDVTERKHSIYKSPETLPNGLKEIPIVAVPYQECIEYPFMGDSFVKDIVLLNRSVLNYSSLINEFLSRQCFNFLAVQTSGPMITDSQSGDEIGTSNLWEYPVGAEQPAYVTPPIDPAEFLQSERDKKRRAIFEIASQNFSSEMSNGEKSSGFSQSQNFAKTVPFIAQRADTLENTENELMRLTMLYKKEVWDGSSKYKDRYEQTNVMDAITQLQAAFKDLNMPSKTFAMKSLKRVVTEIDGKFSAEDLQLIGKEIDELDDDAKFKEWQDAVLSKKAQSPAGQNKPKNSGTLAEVAAEAKMPNTKAVTKLRNNK